MSVLGSPTSGRNLAQEFEESSEVNDPLNGFDDEDGSEYDDSMSVEGGNEESKEDSGDLDRLQMVANDVPDAFAGLESDADNDNGNDDDSSVNACDATDVQLPVLPDMRFDERLLSAIGGMVNIESGVDAVLKDMSVTGWSELAKRTPFYYAMEPYEPPTSSSLRNDYPNLFNGESGRTKRALEAAPTPSGAFFFFMRPDLWEDIAADSNN
ncbi:hypothetical protein PI124_g1618 [Phytophthora idaei]|nr:hypothetical protein PI124_g1618 [Phytophthora idaei]